MGGNQSRTRKLTLENDDPSSVIKVSENVVQRIRGYQAKTEAEQAAPWLAQNPAGFPPYGAPPPFMYPPSITSYQLRQNTLADLKKNDEQWRNKLNKVEENYQNVNDLMNQEYNKAVEEVHGKKVALESYLPPCQSSKEAVVECYRKHPNEPMKCAKFVEAFQECVDSKRAALIANRG